jgi:hypothetical protein
VSPGAGSADYLRKPDSPAGADAGDSPEDLKRAVQDAGGELSRTTVRLFNELKTQAERAVSDSVRSAVPTKNQRGRSGDSERSVTGYIRG